MTLDIDELERELAEATPGPWGCDQEDRSVWGRGGTMVVVSQTEAERGCPI